MNLRRLCTTSLKLAAAIAICAVALHADSDDGHRRGRCPHSPENPTVILALLGTAGVAWEYLRHRARA